MGLVIFLSILFILLMLFGIKIIKNTPDEWVRERQAAARGTGNNNIFVDYSDAMDERENWMEDINARFTSNPSEQKQMTSSEKAEWNQWLISANAKYDK